jgi:hypothetical protein
MGTMTEKRKIRDWIVTSMTTRRFGDQSGQAMTEYLITAGVLLASVAILALFLYTFKEHSGRVLELASSEYP